MPAADQGPNADPVASANATRSPQPAPTRREHLLALALAFVCAVLFLRESLLPGRALVPHPPELFDVVMAEAIADGRFDRDDALRGNVGMADKYLQSLCWDRVMQDRFTTGDLPLWTRDIGGGAPFVPQMAQPYQPINLLLFVLPSEQWYGWWFLIHQVLFGWFAYVFLRRIGCLHLAALLGLCAAVLGMWTQCKLHHNVILTAALSLWPMLTATHDLVVAGVTGRARRWSIGWLALWTGLSWSSGFVVVSLQATYLTLAYAAFGALRAERTVVLRRLVPVAAGLGLGALLSLANMLPVLLAAGESARSGTFDAGRLAALGLEWDHLLGLNWPDLLSWPQDCFYRDANGAPFHFYTRMPLSQLVLLQPLRPEDDSAFQSWVETSFAVGTVPLAAACAALFGRRRRALAWLFASIALLAFGMATADQPFFTLARIVPGLTAGDLRRLLFTVAMALVVLAGLGADQWLRGSARLPGRVVLFFVAAVSAAALLWLWSNRDAQDFLLAYAKLFALDGDDPRVIAAAGDPALIAGQAAAVAAPGEVANNQAMLLSAAGRAVLVAGIGLAALWRMGRFAMPLVIALTITELVIAGLGPMQTVPAERITALPRVCAPIAAAGDADDRPRPRMQRLCVQDRARNNAALPGNIPGFLGLADANAYNPLPPARFEQFFEAIEKGVGYGGAGVGSFHATESLDHALCDLYGIRFVLTRDAVPAGDGLVDRTPAGTGGFRLLERTTVLPRATFVRRVDVLPDAEQRLLALSVPTRDVAHRVVLEDQTAPEPGPAGGGDEAPARVTVTSHRDERVVVRISTAHDGYLRLADPYDPGWRATVDGEPTKIYVADHYLRAVHVAAGEHEVVFTYDGARAVWPPRLSLLALLAIAWLLVTGRMRPATPVSAAAARPPT